MEYTKGEWKLITQPTPHLKDRFYVGTDNYILAETDTKGNAHLIAAAPALYEALKEAVQDYDLLENSSKIERASFPIEEIRQALAQARGK